jgi:hypothetical protein
VLDPGTSRVTAGLLPARSAERGIRAGRAQQRRIAAGRIGVFHVARIGSETGGLVVTADHPVVLGLTILGSVGASTSAAIPDPSYAG